MTEEDYALQDRLHTLSEIYRNLTEGAKYTPTGHTLALTLNNLEVTISSLAAKLTQGA